MANKLYVIGSSSSIWKRCHVLLQGQIELVPLVFTNSLPLMRIEDYSNYIQSCLKQHIVESFSSEPKILFVHRRRDIDQAASRALYGEAEFLLTVLTYLKSNFASSHAILIGSVTGELVSQHADEGYHYQKDFQRSVLRFRSVAYPKHRINMIELGASFQKYSDDECSTSMRAYYGTIKQCLNTDGLPSYQDLARAIRYFVDSGPFQTGNILTLDNSLRHLQRF